jgi:hypothetical protein
MPRPIIAVVAVVAVIAVIVVIAVSTLNHHHHYNLLAKIKLLILAKIWRMQRSPIK